MRMLSLMLFTVLTGATQGTPPSVKDVAWISGCWDLTRNGRHVVENWTPPEGGTMMGVSRTVANGKTTEWEFLVIREGARGLEYVAKASGQPEAIFTSTTVTAADVVFENAAHDFPKKIVYRRDGDALVAAIEGPMNGQARRIEFPYKKVACGG
jgi:Domain of unknown function (DUF6265)